VSIRAALVLFVATSFAQARVHRSQAWADEQFNKAESQRQNLEGRSSQARTRHEYEAVIASYRQVVLDAPTSTKADGSAFLVAQLTAEMGRHFKDQMALYSAVREYKFLRREYPGSKHRVEALLAIGEIYKNDLDDKADARAAFEEFIRRYQHGDLLKEAKAELAALNANSSPGDSDNESAKDNEDDKADNTASADASASKKKRADQKTNTQSQTDDANDDIVRVTSIEHHTADDYTRITVNLDQDVKFISQRISHPDRIYFDLQSSTLASGLSGSNIELNDGRVSKIRIAQFKPDRARLVIETDGRQNYDASLALNPPRLIIDIHTGDAHPKDVNTKAAAADKSRTCSDDDADADDCGDQKEPDRVVAPSTKPSIRESVPKRVIVEADADDPPPDTDEAPARRAPKPSTKTALLKSKRAAKTRLASAMPLREAEPTSEGERSLIRTLGLRIGKIVIDPGHGGHDTGTIGRHGLLEKNLVLDVSKRLGKLLASRLGAEVVFTRSNDTFIPLETRTSIANQEQADLFVSVHANSSHDPDARGVETYYLNFTSSPEALEVAARENAASDKSIHELQDLVKKIALKEKIEESREFASDVQQSLHKGLAVKNPAERDRGVKKAPFVVLIGANMPSILAEISFISNPTDERRLKTAAYRQRIAESLYHGIARYIDGLGGLNVASKMEKSSAD
jgi:N-acetylmuramoyl-L-alanine amidase